ncbi:hypothetical protein AVEN_80979-1 [Araneus ventricosus]|uniref:Uncharacterized protein n=1 Tax=Araneus ventricosus TaxID=182803 RepID=A0A4Y2W5R8_ARAVE|nr:hypothetical protein AVEN_80979-1 [Araneus ventricosus]
MDTDLFLKTFIPHQYAIVCFLRDLVPLGITTSSCMRSRRINKRCLVSLVGIVILMWLVGPTSDNESYTVKRGGWVAGAARNGGYFEVDFSARFSVVAAGLSDSPEDFDLGRGVFI